MTKPLFDVFRDAVMRAPGRGRKEAADWFVNNVTSDPEYFELLARDYFDRLSATWTARQGKDGYAFGRTEAAEYTAERIRKGRASGDAHREAAYASLKASIRDVLLLDLTLPNGEVLRYATGADCAKAGGFYAEIAKHIKPTQVVDKHLTEANLRDIRSRFFQRNKEAA